MTTSETLLGDAWTALRDVIDPELGIDIVTLGLVYDVAITDGAVRVTHSLTTPGCPMEHAIRSGIEHAVGALSGVTSVETNLVWDPVWHPGMIDRSALR